MKSGSFHLNHNQGLKLNSIGYKIDQLIRANILNWEGKEYLFDSHTPIKTANQHMIKSYQANKVRNQSITDINHMLQNGPIFHFRNYHNY